MAHDARSIANLILDNFDAVRFEITNKKINKLIYFCHGFSLVRLDRELIRNHIEAWKHGPVVRVLYEEFRKFEHHPITARASFYDYSTLRNQTSSYENVTATEIELALKVSAHYVQFSADELEERTHRENSPWWRVKNMPPADRGMRDRIPNELILEDFVESFGNVRKNN